MQELSDTMKIPYLQIIGIDERDESQVSGIDQFFNRIMQKHLTKLRKDTLIQIQEAHRPSNRQD